MSDQPSSQRVPHLATSIDGSSASDNGEQIKFGITLDGGGQADIIMAADRGDDLLVLLSTALGQAARLRSKDPNIRYYHPTTHWEIEQMQDPEILRVAFRLPGGAELCFQIDRGQALHLRESLGVILGVETPPTVYPNQKH